MLIMKKLLLPAGVVIAVLLSSACDSDRQATEQQATTATQQVLPPYPISPLPEGLAWETNTDDPVFASADAVTGGTLRLFMLSFPLTLRTVGPDSNGSFRSNINGNQLSLTTFHPNTLNIIPQLATHWAYGDDGKTIYYKLQRMARWSDGRAVTADDYLFTLEFMRSEHIIAPWYNNHYRKEIVAVKKYDDYTISVTGATEKPRADLHYYYNLVPTPRHFHVLDRHWVTAYNWRIQPNTGPYQISKVNKGKSIEFVRKPDWWADELKYFKNRFNVSKVRFTVIRDLETAFRHFLKGELDTFNMVDPKFWHERSKHPLFKEGYIHRIWFYNDTPQPSYGLFLNQDNALLADANIRYAIAHAINMDKLLNNVLRGDYSRLHNIHTGYGAYTNTAIRARGFDLDKVDAYLQQAGWQQRGADGIRVKDGVRLSFTITYGVPDHTDRLILLKEEAKKAGIELQLELLDSSAAFKKILEKKHDIAWMGWSTGLRPAYWQHFHSDNAHKPQTNNITNTDIAALDTLIMTYRDAVDEPTRIRLAKEIQQQIHEQGMYIPTYMAPYARSAYWSWIILPEFYGTKSSLSLFNPFDAGGSGGLFWIDQARRKRAEQARRDKQSFAPVTLKDETYRVF